MYEYPVSLSFLSVRLSKTIIELQPLIIPLVSDQMKEIYMNLKTSYDTNVNYLFYTRSSTQMNLIIYENEVSFVLNLLFMLNTQLDFSNII